MLKIKLDELTTQEWEQQRKWNVDRQKAYWERKLNQLEEQRNINGDAQCVTIGDQGVEMDDNISVPYGEMYTSHRKFCEWIDQLAEVQMCHVCLESYVGIQVCNTSTGPMCMRCLREESNHRFSATNHMDLRNQPHVLEDLTQVEEMLIARASPILQVMHSIGGQYKYQGHAISFP